MPFAIVTISGITSWPWKPQKWLPVRPNPVWTCQVKNWWLSDLFIYLFSPFLEYYSKGSKKKTNNQKTLIVHKNLIPIGGVVGICNLIKIIKHLPSNAESHSLILASSTFVFLPYSVVTRTKYCHRHTFWWLLNYRRVTYSEHDLWNITVTGGWRIGIYDKSFFKTSGC